jgi:hypothetical protein
LRGGYDDGFPEKGKEKPFFEFPFLGVVKHKTNEQKQNQIE